MDLQTDEQKYQGVHDKSDVFPERLQNGSGWGAHSLLRAKIANHQPRRCGRDDAGQTQMISKHITAVGNDGGESDLDLRIVDRLRDLARRVPQRKPENRSPYDRQKKLTDSLSSAQSACNDANKQDLENDYRRPVIQEALALNNDRKPLIHSEVFEDGKHGNWVRSRDDGAEQERY